MARRPARPAVACAAVAVLAISLLAGCGDDEGSTTTIGSDESLPSGDRVVVEAQRGAFSPRAIYDEVSPGVVTVISTFGASSETSIFGGGPAAGQGSGFVISQDGEIATNAHVVTDAQATGTGGALNEADEVYVQFQDRNRVPAEILGFDPFADVALIKVDPADLNIEPLSFGDSAAMRVGDPVAAIGSPFGQEESLSVGVVSATDRSIESLTKFGIDAAIQTDASINPGNSGGPLLNSDAEVIGVNQQINTTSGENAGVGFAVPSNLVERSIEQLREDGQADYAYIGVTSQPLYPQLADHLGLDTETGSLIARIVPGSPAADAGLRAGDEPIRFQGAPVRAGGDVILSVDGEPVVNDSDLPRLISGYAPGDTVRLEVLREGSREELDIKLEPRPGS